ncbi:MAG: hypothetical protein WAO35_27970 [Terriglobia bacterium]
MSQETKKVLEMLASGQISADDAEKLLEKLGTNGAAPATAAASEEGAKPGQKLRFLRVVVDEPDHKQVNIRVPLAMLGTGIKLFAMLPTKASEKLAEKGIDLSALRNLPREELLDQLRELHVDVDSTDGEKVRIFCE